MATKTAKPASTDKGSTKAADTKAKKGDKKPENPNANHPLADKNGRIPHPALECDAEGAPTKLLDGMPEDFDRKVHQPLKAKHFSQEHIWWDLKVAEAEAKVVELKRKSEEAKRLGTAGGASSKLKKFLAIQERAQKMAAELASEGLDVDDIMAQIRGQVEAAEAETANTEETQPAE